MENKIWKVLCSISDVLVYICVIGAIALTFWLLGYLSIDMFKSFMSLFIIM